MLLAAHYHTEILSADSRQCYQEMTIGTAKPDAEALKRIPHYFINSHSVTQEVNAGIYEQIGLQLLGQIFSKNDIAIICGGTGLYIKALLEGIDEMPAIPENIRQSIGNLYAVEGIEGLQQQLQLKDPDFFQQAEQKNPHRLMRALAVWEATGSSILSFRKNKKVRRPFNVIRIGLELPKESLLHNIKTRTAAMMQSGLVQEVSGLSGYRNLKALDTVGYKEIFTYLDGACTLPEAEKNIVLHTRQYAKRQMTWFKKDPAMQWFDPNQTEAIAQYIHRQINNFA